MLILNFESQNLFLIKGCFINNGKDQVILSCLQLSETKGKIKRAHKPGQFFLVYIVVVVPVVVVAVVPEVVVAVVVVAAAAVVVILAAEAEPCWSR
jgi:hypothetical protein